ncbi:hypothetical protein BH23ACT3_BH23ACT3_20830 [soil metagenome]
MDLRRDRLDPALNPPRRRRAVVGTLVGIGGALLVLRESWTASNLGHPSRVWAVGGVVAMALALTWALPSLRRLLPRPGDAPLAVAGVLAVIFLCVPETDQILRVALVVTVVIIAEGVARQPFPLLLLGAVAAYVMWAGIFGATGRQSALVGALFAWWPVLILPLLTLRMPRLADTGTWVRGGIVAIGGVAAAAVARTGALQPTMPPALLAAAVAVPVSLAAGAAVGGLAVRGLSARP